MNTANNTNSDSISAVKAQLKQIGDQIETIAKQLRGQGNQQDIDQLFELGDKVEHFCDDMEFSPVADQNDKSASYASQTNVKSEAAASTAGTSSNANQTGRKNQDDEGIDSQKPNPVM